MSCAGRLDVRTAVNQFRHDVPTKDARIRCDVWQPSLRSGWASAKPSTHESCAAAMVLFDAHDQVRTTVVEPPGAASCRPVSLVLMVVRVRPLPLTPLLTLPPCLPPPPSAMQESLEEAKQWCERAMALTDSEWDDTRLFTLVLVGCVYGDADDHDWKSTGASGSKDAAVPVAVPVAAPVTHGEPGSRGEPTVVVEASEYALPVAVPVAAPVTHGEPGTRGEPTVVVAHSPTVIEASEYARQKGLFFLETAVNTNEEMHRLMVSLVQQVIGKLVARRRREQVGA